jgi:DNA-binding NtrC family response regulator
MASVFIIDDNRSRSAFLKMSLMRERHQVRRSEDIRGAIFPNDSAAPDLVLINQSTQDFNGWELFNHLKQLAPNLPAMVYVLESNRIDSARWICRAVEAACEEAHMSPSPPATTLAQLCSSTMVSAANVKSPFQERP